MPEQFRIRRIKGRKIDGYAACYYCDELQVSIPLYSVRPLVLRSDRYGVFQWPGARIDVLAVCHSCADRAADGEYSRP